MAEKEDGPTTVELSSLNLLDLLRVANDITRSGPGTEYRLASGDPVPQTLFKTPATAHEIKALEDRLGVVLPDDYKWFLGISNGFGSGHENGISNGMFPDPEIYSTENVDWASRSDIEYPLELLDLSASPDLARDVGKTMRQDNNGRLVFETALPLLDRVLEIGVRDIKSIWLVQPELVDKARTAYREIYDTANEEQREVIDMAIVRLAGSKEAFEKLQWCCITDFCTGEVDDRYAGFRQYIEGTIKIALSEYERSQGTGDDEDGL